MRSLHEMQRAFAAVLLDENSAAVEGLFVDGQLPAARLFNIYQNNIRTSLVDVLASTYPVVERLVGAEFFTMMAHDYRQRYPLMSGNVADYGQMLPAFLTDYAAAAQLSYLTDTARLEWAYHEVFHAAATMPFESAILQQTDSEHYSDLLLNLGTACRLVHSKCPIFSIWRANQADRDSDKTIDLNIGPESILVVRPKLEVELWQLGPAETTFLQAVASGFTLGDAVTLSEAQSSTFDLPAILSRHLSSGALIISPTLVRCCD